MRLTRLALPFLMLLSGCAVGTVLVAEPDRVVLAGNPWDDHVSLQPQADRMCAQAGKRAVFAGRRDPGGVLAWHYTYRCQ